VPTVTGGDQVYEYEPNAQAILDEIIPRFTELQLYQALLESQASEHSARMVAMRNASDNASQLVDDLTLVYNKARQAAITSEILDIVGGAEALQETLDKKADALLKDYERAPKIARVSPSNGATQKSNGTTRKSAGAHDDLTKIEGVGPKMSKALKASGIDTFAKLAKSSEEELRNAISSAGMRFSPSLTSWSEQASLAAKGDWEGLEKLQDKLTAGRKA
jgi:predicted flap endonuclease-1-like 5' DNA nuclease